MSKYNPIGEFLVRSGRDFLALDFSVLSGLILGGLPPSAYKYQAWWANQVGNHHPQTKAWRDYGFQTENLDLVSKKVSFRKRK